MISQRAKSEIINIFFQITVIRGLDLSPLKAFEPSGLLTGWLLKSVKMTYQEEHSLLISLSRELLEATFPQEFSAWLDQVVNSYQVALKLHQFHQIFLP